MRKQLIFYFLFIACVLQLFHTVVPHTHLGNHDHSNHACPHENDDNSNTPFTSFLSHFCHGSETFVTNYENNVTEQIIVKQQSLMFDNTVTSFQLLNLYCTKSNVISPILLDFKVLSPPIKNILFRGPPSFS